MRILNITGNGGWQAVSFPIGNYGGTLQARTAADISLRIAGDPTKTFTIKSGSVLTFQGANVTPNSLEIMAANGVVVEVLYGGVVR